MKTRLSIRDQAFAHSPVSNGPVPPVVDGPELVEWDRTTPVSAKTIFTDAEITKAPDGATLWLIEPVGKSLAQWLLINGRSFKAIWTHERQLIEALPNACFVPFGGCWIAPADRRVWEKSKEVSIIASNKHGGQGYDLRHKVIAFLRREVDAFGPEYTELTHKIDALRDYRFQIVVENSRHDFWFTEKLIDCFVTGTVPIYWGCPGISQFFNTAGMMIADNLVTLIRQFDYATTDNYEAMLPAIRDNFERAKRFTLAEDWIAKTHPSRLVDLSL